MADQTLHHPRTERDRVAAYLDALGTSTDPIALAMRNLAISEGVSVPALEVGPLVGSLARIAGARTVLDLGTGTGFMALHIARELPANGILTSVDRDPMRQSQAHAFLERSGIEAAIELRLGEARELMLARENDDAQLEHDMVVLAVSALDLADLLDLTIRQLRPGGLLVVPNMLRDGEVARVYDHDGVEPEPEVVAQRTFNRRFVTDPRLASSRILNIGGGVGIATRV